MDCVECGSKNVVVFFIEKFPCSCCKEENRVEYYCCKECETFWKVIGEFVIDSTKFDSKDASAEPTEIKYYGNSMDDAIHRCLKCNAIAFEVDEDSYHCPKCHFEWETK